jgi:hypothetical protein
MTRIRAKYSLFCKKRPQKGIVYACVYFPSIPVWKVCQGKPYADGRFRYIDNGVEGIARRFNYRVVPESSLAKLRKFVIELNKKTLESLYYKPMSKSFYARFIVPDELNDLPVVDIEDDADELTINNE